MRIGPRMIRRIWEGNERSEAAGIKHPSWLFMAGIPSCLGNHLGKKFEKKQWRSNMFRCGTHKKTTVFWTPQHQALPRCWCSTNTGESSMKSRVYPAVNPCSFYLVGTGQSIHGFVSIARYLWLWTTSPKRPLVQLLGGWTTTHGYPWQPWRPGQLRRLRLQQLESQWKGSTSTSDPRKRWAMRKHAKLHQPGVDLTWALGCLLGVRWLFTTWLVVVRW